MAVRGRDSERGQILIIVAMGFFLVMLAGTAMTIDIGNGILQKRRLQNTADAAALAAASELSRGGSIDDAVAAAQGMVSANTGGAVSLPYNPGVTLGVNLKNGIEIANNSVRVALGRSVPTYFAPAIGVNQINVAAKARAVVGPEGVLPIAFKRFSAGDTSYPLAPPDNPDRVTDYLMPAQDALGNPITIDEWPSPLTASPSPAASDTADGHYDPTVSGAVAPLIGHDAVANVANGNDFHFFVAPDVRGFSQLTPTLYNGAEITDAQSAQLLKNTTVGYILAGGYPGPFPYPGDELAAFSGVTNNDAVHAMQQRYKPGDLVTAMVYNGTVYRKPSFTLQVSPSLVASTNNPPTTASVQVTLVPVNNFTNAGVQFSASGLDGWGDWQFEGGALNTTYTEPITSSSPVTLTFKVTANQPGARTALIQAYAPPPVGSAEGQTRTICATFVVGSVPSFSVASGEAYKVVEQGSGTRFDLDVEGWNGIGSEYAPVSWAWADAAPSGTVTISVPSSVQVRNGHSTSLRVNVDVGSDASIGEYPILLTVKDADPNHQERNQTIVLTLAITSSSTNSTVLLNTSFVKVLGYANFRIDYFTNNTVYAHAVSGLVSWPDLLGKGLKPRLVPW
jgi:hypothetical protein